jgi:hypothetical protein
LNSNSFNLSYLRNLQEQVKKEFCYQKLFWLFEWIVLVIKFFLQILGLQPRISNFFSITRTIFSHSSQNNFGNKIPFLASQEFASCKFGYHLVYKMWKPFLVHHVISCFGSHGWISVEIFFLLSVWPEAGRLTYFPSCIRCLCFDPNTRDF